MGAVLAYNIRSELFANGLPGRSGLCKNVGNVLTYMCGLTKDGPAFFI